MIALVIILGFIGVIVLSWWRLWWGAAVIIALAPTYLLRFKLFFVPTTFLEVAIYIVFAVWLIRLIQRRVVLTPLKGFWAWFLPLWLVIGVVAAYFSPDVVAALGIWKAYFFDAVLFFMVFITTITTRQQLNRAFWLAGSIALAVALVAVWQALGLLPSSEPWIDQSPPRVSSVFEYPNALGLFVAPLVSLFLPAALGVGLLSYRRRFAWGVVIGGTLATVLAISQGAWLGIAAALLVAALFSPHRRRWLTTLLIIAIVVLLLPATRQSVVELATLSDTSGDVRLRLWQGTIALLQDRPLVGAGLTGFPELYDVYRDAAHVELLLYPHNIILNFWVTLGLAGLAAVIVLLVRFFYGLRRPTADPWLESIRIGLVAAMVALLIHGLVDVPYFKNDLAIVFWYVIGCAVVFSRLSMRDQVPGAED